MIVPVKTDTWNYDIVLEPGAIKKAGELLNLNRRVLVVTDSGVPAQYAETVAAQCGEAAIVTIPQGEQSKCFDELRHLLSEMLDKSFTRGDCVVAVGGGVVGDLSGFAASCYMRGVDFYNIPTTLLSQVDTLSRRQLMAGLAEAIKMAATNDAELFELIENSADLTTDLPQIIYRALMIKKNVVEQDPRETGLRKVLNFGHTIGHAVESFNAGKLLHGECVALGMIPMSGESAAARIKSVLEKYGLPSKIGQSAEELMPFLKHDKKMASDGIAAVIVDEIGSFRLCRMSADEILSRLEG